MQNFDGIMFDLDGTLWDSTETAARVWSEVVKKHGISVEVTKERLKQLYGLPLEEIAVRLFQNLPEQEAIEIMEECVVVQCPVLEQEGGILLGKIGETLKELKQRYPLFIISNCRSGYIEAFLKAHELSGYFTDFECPGGTGKLKAENIRLVMERNGIKNPVYVGDTEGDRTAAKEAGVSFIFAGYGFGEVTEESSALHIIQSFDELSALL